MQTIYFFLILIKWNFCENPNDSIDSPWHNNEITNFQKNIQLYKKYILPYLSLKNFNDDDLAYQSITKNFFKIIYFYPNFLIGYGVSLNYYDLLNEVSRDSIDKQFIEGFLKNKILDALFNITINFIIKFDNFNELLPNENKKSYEKNKENYSKYMGLFIDNWLMEEFSEENFFQWITNLQKSHGIHDHIYIYLTIINDYDILKNIYSKISQGEDMLKFKDQCIFFNLLQSRYEGMFGDVLLFKVTYPSRINYNILNEKFCTNNLHEIYQFSHRWILTKIYQKTSIMEINLRDILNIKGKFYKNFASFDKNIQSIILLYFFINKYDNLSNKDIYEKYCYWLLCKYYGNYYQYLWQKKFKESQQKSKKS
jgi:hypothetical protein